MLDVEGLFSDGSTYAEFVQQQKLQFARLLAKGRDDKPEKPIASSSTHGGVGLVQLQDVKPFQTNCARGGTPPAVRLDDVDESETLRRALGTVPQLLEKLELINRRGIMLRIKG